MYERSKHAKKMLMTLHIAFFIRFAKSRYKNADHSCWTTRHLLPMFIYFSIFFSTDWKSITSSAGSITSIFHRKSIIWEEKLLLYEKGRNYASLSTKKLPLPILNEFACDEPGTIGRHKLGYGHVIPLSKKKTPSTIPWLRENPTSV